MAKRADKMKVDWNLWEKVAMQNFRAKSAVTQQGNSTQFFVSDGLNGKFRIECNNPVAYVDKEEFIEILLKIQLEMGKEDVGKHGRLKHCSASGQID